MQYPKIVVLSLLLLCPGFSFADFEGTDSAALANIENTVLGIWSETEDLNDKIGSYGNVTIFDFLRDFSADNSYFLDYLYDISSDIDYIRQTQLSAIRTAVVDSEKHLKEIRYDFGDKLANLALIASSLSGQNVENISINLGFDSIGKNVQKLADTTDGISNNVANIRQNLSNVIYTGDDGLDYLRIAPAAGDLSVLTNFALGSAFLGPWEMENEGGAGYYTLYQRYKNGDISPEIFIAEMGLYNWLAGLNFGDWYVTPPDDADLEDSQGWGIVENAKQEWSALAEYTAFPPYSSSDARFWLYGTRYLTDYVGDILKFFNTNAVAQISDAFPEITDEIENPSTDDFPEDIQPEEPNEQQTQLEEILKTSEDSTDPFERFEYILNNVENSFSSVDASTGNLDLHFNLNFLGVDQTVTVSIQQQAKAKQAISTAIKFVCNGFKLASALFIACAVAKTLTSYRFRVVMMFE